MKKLEVCGVSTIGGLITSILVIFGVFQFTEGKLIAGCLVGFFIGMSIGVSLGEKE